MSDSDAAARPEPKLVELRQERAGGGFIVLFHVWGWFGFVIGVFSVLGTMFMPSVGVGTSAYVTMGLTFWIGGMVLLGLAALLSTS